MAHRAAPRARRAHGCRAARPPHDAATTRAQRRRGRHPFGTPTARAPRARRRSPRSPRPRPRPPRRLPYPPLLHPWPMRPPTLSPPPPGKRSSE
eukprot:5634721-Prymnesium_polylepis.3